MKAWRMGHRAFQLMDGEGAARFPGRWNRPGQRAVYCGTSFAITMLERLCYTGSDRMPKTDVYVEIDVPDELIDEFDAVAHPGWERPRSTVAKGFGGRWLSEGTNAALLVPSAVTQIDQNVVLNPLHPDFSRVSWSSPKAVKWDRRLFIR
jgi:RES domain-containing protein